MDPQTLLPSAIVERADEDVAAGGTVEDGSQSTIVEVCRSEALFLI